MKRKIVTLLMSFLLCFSLFVLVGCNNGSNPEDDGKFKIEFMVEGSVYHTIKTKGNEILTFPAEPIKTGYDFNGWYLDNETFENEITVNSFQTTALENNIKVYAKMEKTRFKIEFMVEGSVYHTIKTSGNEILTLPAEPTKDGYGFNGWYLDNGTFKNEITANSFQLIELKNDIKVYPKMEKIFEVTSNKIKELTAYGETLTEIKIPSSIDGVDIKEIANMAFAGNESLEKVEISNNIEKIGESAFAFCPNLETVIFEADSKLTTIGIGAFNDTNIKNITIPSSVTAIGAYVFCSVNLESIIFENTASWKFVKYDGSDTVFLNASDFADPAVTADLFQTYLEYDLKRV